MTLKSLAVDDNSNYPSSCGPNPYGYGTQINLNAAQVAQLGIAVPDIGTTVAVQAIAVVVEVVQRTDVDGDADAPQITLALQLTDMELTGGSSAAEQADKLYGGSK